MSVSVIPWVCCSSKGILTSMFWWVEVKGGAVCLHVYWPKEDRRLFSMVTTVISVRRHTCSELLAPAESWRLMDVPTLRVKLPATSFYIILFCVLFLKKDLPVRSRLSLSFTSTVASIRKKWYRNTFGSSSSSRRQFWRKSDVISDSI